MKQNILFIFLCVFAFSLNAQVLEVGEVVYEQSFEVDLTDNWSEPIVHGKVTNTTQDMILLRWELETPDGPAEWEYRVCDNNQCYTNYEGIIIIEPYLCIYFYKLKFNT